MTERPTFTSEGPRGERDIATLPDGRKVQYAISGEKISVYPADEGVSANAAYDHAGNRIHFADSAREPIGDKGLAAFDEAAKHVAAGIKQHGDAARLAGSLAPERLAEARDHLRIRAADEPWKMPRRLADKAVIYSNMQKATGWNEGETGSVRTFYRLGAPPESGYSFNAREGKRENGVSVYVTPTAGSAISSRPWYYGKGQQVSVGGDEEPVVKVAGEWKKFPGHKAVVRQALEEGKPVPDDVLADYPDLRRKYRPKK